MRSLLAAAVVGLGCASGPPASSTLSGSLALPRWAEPTTACGPTRVVASTTLPEARVSETVRIEAPTPRDPVDVLVTARRGRQRLRSFALHEAPVGETLRMFAEVGRFNVIVPAEYAGRRVSLTLRDVSLLAAFRAVLSAAQLQAAVVGGEVVEVRPTTAL